MTRPSSVSNAAIPAGDVKNARELAERLSRLGWVGFDNLGDEELVRVMEETVREFELTFHTTGISVSEAAKFISSVMRRLAGKEE